MLILLKCVFVLNSPLQLLAFPLVGQLFGFKGREVINKLPLDGDLSSSYITGVLFCDY